MMEFFHALLALVLIAIVTDRVLALNFIRSMSLLMALYLRILWVRVRPYLYQALEKEPFVVLNTLTLHEDGIWRMKPDHVPDDELTEDTKEAYYCVRYVAPDERVYSVMTKSPVSSDQLLQLPLTPTLPLSSPMNLIYAKLRFETQPAVTIRVDDTLYRLQGPQRDWHVGIFGESAKDIPIRAIIGALTIPFEDKLLDFELATRKSCLTTES
jgi:hypothetical protein